MDARARMEREAEAAETELMEGAPPEPKPEDAAGLPGGEPKPDAENTPVPEKSEGGTDVAALQTEISRLTAQLDSENSQTFKARYQTLQGMFNTETGRLKAEIEELKVQLAAKPAAHAVPAMTDEQFAILVKEVGEPAAEIMRANAAPQTSAELAELRNELAALKGETKAASQKAELAQAQTAEERFMSNLNTLTPDWKSINGWESDGIKQDPRFTAFAHQPIPGAGMTYQDALVDQYQKGSAAGVAEIFNLFKKSVETPVSSEKKLTAAEELARQLEPDKTGKGVKVPVLNAADKEIIPMSEYDAFCNSITRNTFRGTREERLKLEARYDKAMSEDRIR
jgi:uncharacterized small protein (DUF1192 family)